MHKVKINIELQCKKCQQLKLFKFHVLKVILTQNFNIEY